MVKQGQNKTLKAVDVCFCLSIHIGPYPSLHPSIHTSIGWFLEVFDTQNLPRRSRSTPSGGSWYLSILLNPRNNQGKSRSRSGIQRPGSWISRPHFFHSVQASTFPLESRGEKWQKTKELWNFPRKKLRTFQLSYSSSCKKLQRLKTLLFGQTRQPHLWLPHSLPKSQCSCHRYIRSAVLEPWWVYWADLEKQH